MPNTSHPSYFDQEESGGMRIYTEGGKGSGLVIIAGSHMGIF